MKTTQEGLTMSSIRFSTIFTITALMILGSPVLGEDKPAETSDASARKISESRDISKIKSMSFEKINSDKDLLRGFVTYSRPSKDDGRNYEALICLRWGDLDNLIPKIKSDFYSNWDGYVKVHGGGRAYVIKEFAFDDGDPAGGETGKGGLGEDSSKNIPDRESKEPGLGSGRDELIKDQTSSMVAWKSGVVGATDGILIKVELQKPEAKGEIKAGNFVIPYEIKPLPNRNLKEKKPVKLPEENDPED
mgnify:CR=1 FL=1